MKAWAELWRLMVRGGAAAGVLFLLMLSGCSAGGMGAAGAGVVGYSAENAKAIEALGKQPLATEPWAFADVRGNLIRTPHYHIYTTLDDPLYEHLVVRVLEAAHERVMRLNPQFQMKAGKELDCYIFGSRGQWESYTRARAGSNAPIYLQISSGGYCQEGVFAGYDIGRQQTLSVIAHEAFHQYSWFAFKDRLPAWLEEGLATQNEAMEWHGADPVFVPEKNVQRLAALRKAMRNGGGGKLWGLYDLLSTHAGQVIKKPQGDIDSYYAQLWSFVLFLEQSEKYRPRLQSLLADAVAGKLTQALMGTSVTQREIDGFTEHWNTVAGPVYVEKYLNADLRVLEEEYVTWARGFVGN